MVKRMVDLSGLKSEEATLAPRYSLLERIESNLA